MPKYKVGDYIGLAHVYRYSNYIEVFVRKVVQIDLKRGMYVFARPGRRPSAARIALFDNKESLIALPKKLGRQLTFQRVTRYGIGMAKNRLIKEERDAKILKR